LNPQEIAPVAPQALQHGFARYRRSFKSLIFNRSPIAGFRRTPGNVYMIAYSFGSPVSAKQKCLVYSDFRRAPQMLDEENVTVVELSALRMAEWEPLLQALVHSDLSRFKFCSLHLPSLMNGEEERTVVRSSQALLWRKWPLIVHPDAISDFGLWRELGSLLCIENMDKRKPVGRTASELDVIFGQLPETKFCFDIGTPGKSIRL